jgi:CRISPR-associated protein Cmr6
MALANVGVQLARKGKRVLMVDWDLDAPGLDMYFSQNSQVGTFLVSQAIPHDNTGLLGLLCDAKTESEQSSLVDSWKRRLSKITISSGSDSSPTNQASATVSLDLLASGHDSINYSSRLGSFSWETFFSEYNGGVLLEELRDQWKSCYDFVLIDSRTGLTDAGGVCTVQMPEMLVLIFTANSQSLDGGFKYLSGVEKAREVLAYERTPLTVFPLLARWEGDKEVDLSEQWLERIENQISPYIEVWCPADLPIRRLLERLRVPHVARFSFGEPLPVLSHSLTDPSLPGLAYDLLSDLISGPLSRAGTIIDPTYREPVDLMPESMLDKYIHDEEARRGEEGRLKELHGANLPELYKFHYRLADRALQLENHRLANSLVKSAVDVARHLVSISPRQEIEQMMLVRALRLQAEINQQQGSQTSALEAYHNVLLLLTSLQETYPSKNAHAARISSVLEKIGDIHRSMGNPEKALHSYQEAIATKPFPRKPQSEKVNDLDFIILKEKVGDILLDTNDLNGAYIVFRDCLAETGNPPIGSALSPDENIFGRIHKKMGNILLKQKNPIGALASYQEIININSGRIDIITMNPGRQEMSAAYIKIGNLSADAGKLEQAFDAYGKALLINASLNEEDPTDITKQREFNEARDKYEQFLRQQIRCSSSDVPMEYRAQVPGRCQRQYIKKPQDAPPGWRSDLQRWIDQWLERVDPVSPFTGKQLRIVEAQVDWRLISNSGVDEGIIRPVIGAGGWPMIPGSSIKGLFRRACGKLEPNQLIRWCGGTVAEENGPTLQPGCLRFHGAWPADGRWTSGLLDLSHPQQDWQVGIGSRKNGGAFAVVSLYRPRLLIGLSSNKALSEGEWEEVTATLRSALAMGIGGRTCVGYGSSGRLTGDLLFECTLEGQGPAAKLLDGTAEFRPTMFRAAIRGMALRLFGGVTDARTARQVVGRLLGSLSPEDDRAGNVGLVATAYTEATTELGSFGWQNYQQPIYATSGRLQWRRMRACRGGEEEALLIDLLAALHGLTMSLGGFGRGWRRPDHRIFLLKYDKTPIGCHWQWRDVANLPPLIHIQSPEALAKLLQRSRGLARQWLKFTGQPIGEPAPWREVIHPQQMRIWTRRATDPADAEAVAWFHHSPAERDVSGEQSDPRDLKRTILAGQMNQVGLIWNRLLPLLDSAVATSQASRAKPPANPLARPAPARVARPMDRPATARQQARPPQGSVSIAAHQGAYLESLVLHSLPADAQPEARQLHARFVAEMNRGGGAAHFLPLAWGD